MDDFINEEARRKYQEHARFDELRRRRHVPHNHAEKQKILTQLHISPLEQFLLWLAKTDIYALSLATFQSRIILSGMGMMVLFTSLMALCTSSYTIATTMVTDGGVERWIVVAFLAAIYGFGIMIIDREIVGASGGNGWVKTAASTIMRAIFALGIALTVSFPVELKLFEGRIATEIQNMETQQNLEFERKIGDIKQPYLDASKASIDGLQASINGYNAEIRTLTDEIEREAKNVECAARCQGFRTQKEAAETKKAETQAELNRVMSAVSLPPLERAEVQKLEKQMEANRGHQDLMTKWEALERLKKQPGSNFAVLSYFIMFFFMLLELVPLSLKMTLGKTEYHYYLEARSALNNQKIIGIANYYLDQMINNPSNTENMPTEITDIIARHLEDEQMAGPEAFDTANPDNIPEQAQPDSSTIPAQDATVDERGGG